MLKGFEELTKELTPKEVELAKIIAKWLPRYNSKDDTVTSGEICRGMNARKKETGLPVLTGPRLRKIIGELRVNSLLAVCGNANGYWVESDPEKLRRFTRESLRKRADKIYAASDGLDELAAIMERDGQHEINF
jgi:hypothetical protein